MAAFGIRIGKLPRGRIVGLAAGAGAVVVGLLVAALVAGGGGGPSRSTTTTGAPILGAVSQSGAGGGSAGTTVNGPAAAAAGGTAGAGSTAGVVGGAGSAAAVPSSGAASAPAPAPPLVPAKVIKNGQIYLQVRPGRVAAALNDLTLLAAAEGGFVASTTSAQAGPAPSGTVVLRVPAGVFEVTLGRVRALGTVVSASTSGQDVTAQYVDLQARITALQQAQGRYLTILARANTIGDILAVQQQIDSVGTQLEQLEGQQRVTDDQTSYGTLTVNVDQRTAPPPPARPAPGPWKAAVLRAGNGFADGIQGLVSVSGTLAFALVLVAALGALSWLGWRRLGSRRRPPGPVTSAPAAGTGAPAA
ncbi:MAG TPA: DUF4349 domain-containing protein [Acidimicrobiales bacterium]|nr:DUF4349 domain-containing protein [Acidimicrobiales bacterium]